MMKHTHNEAAAAGLAAAIEAAGTAAELARRLEISRSAVCQWREVPLDRVVEVEKVTGIPRYVLRPDFFVL